LTNADRWIVGRALRVDAGALRLVQCEHLGRLLVVSHVPVPRTGQFN
jgi:hypothetical protein